MRLYPDLYLMNERLVHLHAGESAGSGLSRAAREGDGEQPSVRVTGGRAQGASGGLRAGGDGESHSVAVRHRGGSAARAKNGLWRGACVHYS